MNPIRLWKLGRRANKAAGVLDEAANRTTLYRDPRWWGRALEACAEVLEIAPVPPALRDTITRWKRMKNWKTTLAGVAGVLTMVVKVVNGGGIGAEDIAILTGLLGLFVAKDSDVTGGTREQ